MANPVPAGSDVSAGTYRCTNCGNERDVSSTKHLPPCPTCGNGEYETVTGSESVDDRTRTARTSGRGLMCAECGAVPDSHASGWRGGWRAYLAFDPAADDFPYTVLFCPRCAAGEFGPLPRAKCRVDSASPGARV